MKYCVVCNQQKSCPICKGYSNKPFKVEEYRQSLASIGDLDTLVKTYNQLMAEIKNLNTSSFWNERLKESVSLRNQDGMTKDRVNIAFRYLPKTAKRILDIGIGYGFIEEFLSKSKNIEIFGNDISPLAIKNAKNKFDGCFRVESIYDMKYTNNFFDTVFVLEVLEHIPPSKIFGVLKNIKRLLKKCGILIVSVPSNEGLETMKYNSNGHMRDYTKPLIESELKLCGFKILDTKSLYAFETLYTIKKVIAKVLKNQWRPNNIVIKAGVL